MLQVRWQRPPASQAQETAWGATRGRRGSGRHAHYLCGHQERAGRGPLHGMSRRREDLFAQAPEGGRAGGHHHAMLPAPRICPCGSQTEATGHRAAAAWRSAVLPHSDGPPDRVLHLAPSPPSLRISGSAHSNAVGTGGSCSRSRATGTPQMMSSRRGWRVARSGASGQPPGATPLWTNLRREGPEEPADRDDYVFESMRGDESSRDVRVRGLDLGCGLGSVLLMMCWQLPSATYVGVEAQQTSLDRARRSAYANACDDRVDIRHGDIKDIRAVVPEGPVFDVITGTPPYFDPFGAEASSVPSTDPQTSLPPLPRPRSPPATTSSSSSAAAATTLPPPLSSAPTAAVAAKAKAVATAPQPVPSPATPGGPSSSASTAPSQPPPPAPLHPPLSPLTPSPVPVPTATTTSKDDTPTADQIINHTHTSAANQQQTLRRASGKIRDRPVPLPVATDQRPSNFEYRGGIEVYCQGAKACLARGGLFIVCAGERYGGGRRVLKAAEDAGLAVLRKVEVVPKESHPPLFSVYSMCLPPDHHPFRHVMDTHTSVRSITHRLQMHTPGNGTHAYTRAEAKASLDTQLSVSHANHHLEHSRVCGIRSDGSGSDDVITGDHAQDQIDTTAPAPVARGSGVGSVCGSVHGVCVKEEMNSVGGVCGSVDGVCVREEGGLVVETVVVRRADGRRTDAYVRLMADLGMPDVKGALSDGGDDSPVDA